MRAAALAHQPLTIVGRGPHEARLRALARGARRRRVFTGHLTKDALAAAIQEARAVVVPSECHENAPLALLEAYAAGRPVIGSRIAGIPELVREDETGVLYPAGDADALAEALTRFAGFPDARVSAMGAAGRAWVEKDFNAAIYLDRQLALYDSLGVAGPMNKRADPGASTAERAAARCASPCSASAAFPMCRAARKSTPRISPCALADLGCDVEAIVRSGYVAKDQPARLARRHAGPRVGAAHHRRRSVRAYLPRRAARRAATGPTSCTFMPSGRRSSRHWPARLD